MKLVNYSVLLMLLFSSCMKEASNEFSPLPNNLFSDTAWSQKPAQNAPVYQLATLFPVPALVDSFNITTGGTLRLSNSLLIIIPPNVAVLPSGQNTQGTVKVEVIYLKTKGNYVSYSQPTTHYNRLLTAAGSFNIKFYKAGQELITAPAKKIVVQLADTSPLPNLAVFFGEQNIQSSLPVGINSAFTWLPATDSSRVSIFQRLDSNVLVRGYEIISSNFNWLSCQVYVDTLQYQKTRMDVIMPFIFTNNNTSVYLVFKNKKTVVQLFGDQASKTFYASYLPINEDVQLVTLSKIGNDLYLGRKELAITHNSILQLTPEKKTKAQLTEYLGQL